ncbi:MAG: homocysteine S-methyltransferase family protein [Clostridia bacterium]|nr:homocysteine S-methyltransferase family protein [Clostridia bacterium]
MDFREFASSNTVILDGGMGTLLERRGLMPGEAPELWSVSHPDEILAIHKEYFDAGSNVVNTNTFGANSLKYGDDALSDMIGASVGLAKKARELSSSRRPKFISLDIGPLGRLLEPYGDLSFDEAYGVFTKTVKIGAALGVDLVTIETFNDSLETRAALLAVKENSDLPVIVTNAYGEDGKLLTGADAAVMAEMLSSMGADFIGANCSLGPNALLPIAEDLVRFSSVPTVLKPNAGLPVIEKGETVYNVTAEEFAACMETAAELGVRMLGGCCGTTPEYISLLSERLSEKKPKQVKTQKKTVITSHCQSLALDDNFTVIGESINPTGRKKVKEALRNNDTDSLIDLAELQESCGAHALDVNVGMPDISESEMLVRVVNAIQYSVPLPLAIDTSDAAAMEKALRIYNGKALINSVSGKEESMNAIFPLQKKYGGVVIALTLDENGIPSAAEERVRIAKRILRRAAEYGIDKRDIVFDPLAMAVSSDKGSAIETLKAIRVIREELGCKTSLGLSNISYGLPKREAINSAFLSMAMTAGLSMAIMNPASAEMMKAYYSSRALLGMDGGFSDYISASESFSSSDSAAFKAVKDTSDAATLEGAIIKGKRETAGRLAEKLLSEKTPMAIIEEHIIPALNEVGEGYEKGRIYLPGLLESAECASAAFSVIKAAMPKGSGVSLGRVVIATVKGDVHDIGKNIVKLLLENYGFYVKDLGKDVSPERILEAARSEKCDIVALSALMTTTVKAMEETVKLIKSQMPKINVLVGGAVLTEDYAKRIGADGYAKDAMGAVRYAEKLIKSKG